MQDFDKYAAITMVEQLKNVAQQVKDKKADFYATVFSSLQERIDRPLEHFRSYVLSLLGDREYEKVVDSIAKVDRAFNRDTVPIIGCHHVVQVGSLGFFLLVWLSAGVMES